MNFKADLHCHSSCSDGADTPQALLLKAKSADLSGISITDHDTITAYTKELFAKAQELQILLGTGIELSCRLDGFSVHILGYGFDPDHPLLKDLCALHQKKRYLRNLKICHQLEKMGMPVGTAWLMEDKKPRWGLGRPHIAHRMMEKSYVATIAEAFRRYLGEGKPAYFPSSDITIAKSIEVIHQSGGKAFLAHPHLIKRSKLIRQILTMDFDGIECFYAGHHLLPWRKIAEEKRWLISGGSDYHGEVKPESRLGSSYVGCETFTKIFNL